MDEHNHALAALRYLIATRDEHKMCRRRIVPATPTVPDKTPEELAREEEARRYWQKQKEKDDLWFGP